MPCRKGMTGCKRSCLHRAMVGDYRTARLGDEERRDSAVGAYGPGSPEWRDYEPRPIVFKTWLTTWKGERGE